MVGHWFVVSIQWFADLSPQLLNPTGEGTQPSKPPNHRATEPPNHHIATNLKRGTLLKSGWTEPPHPNDVHHFRSLLHKLHGAKGPGEAEALCRAPRAARRAFFFLLAAWGSRGFAAVGDCSAVGARYGCQGYERQDCPLYGVLDWHYPKETGELRRGNGAPCGSWALQKRRRRKSTGLKGP